MRITWMILVCIAVAFLVVGCGKFIKSTDQRLAIAYDTYTGVVTSATTLCKADVIPRATCIQIAETATEALTALDTAQAILTGAEKPQGKKDARYYMKYGIGLLKEAQKLIPRQTHFPALIGAGGQLALTGDFSYGY